MTLAEDIKSCEPRAPEIIEFKVIPILEGTARTRVSGPCRRARKAQTVVYLRLEC
jgi:hypothetical protein